MAARPRGRSNALHPRIRASRGRQERVAPTAAPGHRPGTTCLAGAALPAGPRCYSSRAMAWLCLLRHGQSQWNLENRFTGWVDGDLTERGEAEARKGGGLVKGEGAEVERAFPSVQPRAIRTLWLSLQASGQCWIPVEKDWRLNERHYGGLTGLDKAETAAKHGDEQVKIWRRSYDVPPPPLAPGGEF